MRSWVMTRKTIVSLLLALSIVGVGRLGVYADQAPSQSKMVKGAVTVQFEDDVDVSRLAKGFGSVGYGIPSLDNVLRSYDVESARPIFLNVHRPAINSGLKDLTRFQELRFPDTIDVNVVIQALMQNPHVRVAEPVWLYPVTEMPGASPNDPQWNNQWHMSPPGPDPQYYLGWNMETGADTVKIAIIDTGVLYAHPDLTGNIWVNPGEDLDHDGVVMDPDDLNGVDDDGDGIVDDLIGYDFLNSLSSCYPGEDCTAPDPDPADFNGHGTHCAGIAAAMTNNNLNVTGIAGGWFGNGRWTEGVRIMCLRAGGTASDGLGYINSNDAATAANYAVQKGAVAINASFGGGSLSSSLAAAIDNAVANGCSYVHSAGNDNVSTPGWEDNRPGVLSVAATTSLDTKASFSNYGTWIDISAPGQYILSTYSNHYTPTTAYLDGTSMAAPNIVGSLALIRSMMPSLSRAQADSILLATADNIDAANPTYVGELGSGRVNINNALSGLANAKFSADVVSGNVPLAVQFTDQSPNSPTAWDWTLGDGTTSTEQNPAHTYTVPGPNGIYTVDLKETESNGVGEEALRNYIWARADTCIIDSVEVEPGDTAKLNVYLANTSPEKEIFFAIKAANTADIKLTGFNWKPGMRASDFDTCYIVGSASSIKSWVIYLKPYGANNTHVLPAGNGVLFQLLFNVPLSAPRYTVVTVDTATLAPRNPKVTSIWGDYWPVFKPGKIVIKGCMRGDANCDGVVDVGDLTMLVDFLFFDGPAPDLVGGNVDGLGGTDISDLTYLVDFLFNNGPNPPAL
jgi:subtilisin family serine protease